MNVVYFGLGVKMITIDPFQIDLLIADCIIALERCGALDSVPPDAEYGYICDSVFGFCSADVGAIRGECRDWTGLLWFHLTDGRVIPAVPMPPSGPVIWCPIKH